MHTNRRWLTGFALAAVCFAAPDGHAQNPPARLPAVVVNARPDLPGARKIAGTVRDTFATPIDAAEISIPELQRRFFSRPDGSFRFEGIKPGTYDVRARKIGFAPQVQQVVVDDSGGVGVFALVPTARRLEPVVSSAVRGGLSGTVGDTSYQALAGATVRIVGHNQGTKTDSIGAFFLPLRAGTYVASVTRDGYQFRLVSVIIPPDSGRSVTVFLAPQSGAVSHEEGSNLFEFEKRLEYRSTLKSRVYTRAELQAEGIEWALDAVRRGTGAVASRGQTWVDPDCSVVVNGGPKITELNTLTVDDIETIEVYPGSQNPSAVPASRRAVTGRTQRGSPIAIDQSTTRLATWANRTKKCPLVYVWMR